MTALDSGFRRNDNCFKKESLNNLFAKGCLMNRLIAGFAFVFAVFVGTLTPAFADNAMTTTARSAIVVDLNSGAILLDKDADKRIPTASMSKTMTIYMVFDALKKGQIRLDSMLPVSEKAWRTGGSKMFVKVGDSVSVEDLIKGVIIQSGNDATVVLAEGIAGTEERFAADMTNKAHELGMTSSNFMNANGLPDPNHYSTPHDLALLAWHLIRDFPEYYHYFGMTEFTYNGIHQPNRDLLLSKVPGADGLKTGHTEEAGYCLIGSAQRQGRRVIMVITGLPTVADRETEGARLMNWALDSFKVARLYKAGAEVGRAPVIYGLTKDVPLVLTKDVDMTVPIRIMPADIAASISYNSPIVAPLKKGEQVGVMKVTVPGIGTKEYPVVTGADVVEKGFMGRTFEHVLHAVSTKK